jgi:hypothetical protein
MCYKNFIDHFIAAGGDPSIPQDMLGVKAEYLRASFDQVQTQYGSIENYFDKGLGIDRAGQQKLRDRFLQANSERRDTDGRSWHLHSPNLVWLCFPKCQPRRVTKLLSFRFISSSSRG